MPIARNVSSAATLVLGAAIGIAGCGQTGVAPRVTEGESVIGVVRFPSDWTTVVRDAGSERVAIIQFGKAQAKRPAGDQGGELLLAMLSADGATSTEHYAISTDGRFRVRPASDEEWNAGETLAVRAAAGMPSPAASATSFRYSGQSWVWVTPSNDERTTAVVSVTETERPNSWFFIEFGGRYRGTQYLELFDTASHARLGAAEADYRGSATFELATWFESRAFLLPLEALARTCLLALAPVP